MEREINCCRQAHKHTIDHLTHHTSLLRQHDLCGVGDVCMTGLQVGFVTRLEGQRLTADLQDYLPDYQFAFEGAGEEVGGMYYYSDTTRALNDEMGDMLHKIHDFEVRSGYAAACHFTRQYFQLACHLMPVATGTQPQCLVLSAPQPIQ